MTSMPALSPRMRGIHASPASILRRRARELRATGRDIIELSSGNLDFATPDHVTAAAHAAALRGETRYTDVDGTGDEAGGARRAAARPSSHLCARRDHHLQRLDPGAVQRPAVNAGDGKPIATDRDFAAYLLDHADLVVVAGAHFGLSPYIRITFANPSSTIEEAGRRLQRACEALR